MSKNSRVEEFRKKALVWCEKYGIVESKIKGSNLIYNVSYPAYLSEPRRTYQHIVNLITMKEKVVLLKKYDPKGAYNR